MRPEVVIDTVKLYQSMPTPIENEIARSVLLKEQRKANAKAVLNRLSS